MHDIRERKREREIRKAQRMTERVANKKTFFLLITYILYTKRLFQSHHDGSLFSRIYNTYFHLILMENMNFVI